MKTDRGRGRPSKLTPIVRDKLIQAIKVGSHLNAACAYAGVDYSNFRRWMRKGESQTKGEFCDFRDAIRISEAELEIRLVATWQQAAANDWRAAAEFLSRRFPDRWASTQKFQVQLEAELNAIYDKIENDPNIPLEYKKIIFETLSSSGESAPNQN